MKLIIFMFSVLVCMSCKEPMVGTCDSPIQAIVSAPKQVEQHLVYTIQVKNPYGWWISNVHVNGADFSLGSIDTSHEEFKLQNDSVGIERLNKEELKIILEKEERVELNIMFQSGNCFKSVELKQ